MEKNEKGFEWTKEMQEAWEKSLNMSALHTHLMWAMKLAEKLGLEDMANDLDGLDGYIDHEVITDGPKYDVVAGMNRNYVIPGQSNIQLTPKGLEVPSWVHDVDTTNIKFCPNCGGATLIRHDGCEFVCEDRLMGCGLVFHVDRHDEDDDPVLVLDKTEPKLADYMDDEDLDTPTEVDRTGDCLECDNEGNCGFNNKGCTMPTEGEVHVKALLEVAQYLAYKHEMGPMMKELEELLLMFDDNGKYKEQG